MARRDRAWRKPLSCVLSAAIGAAAVSADARGAEVRPDIVYVSPGCQVGANQLDLFTPNGGVAAGAPTVVMIHGGGYSGGDKSWLTPWAAGLADRGYNVVNINYTLTTAGHPSYPQAVMDVMNVVRWVRTAGVSSGLSDVVVIMGESAGATVATTAAMAAGTTTFVNQTPAAVRGTTIDGVVTLYGRYDLVWNVNVGIPGTVVDYLGTPIGAPGWASVYAQASAVTYVGGCSPPTALFHGSADPLVPVGNSYRLQTALVNAGVYAPLTIVPGGGHGIGILGTVDQASDTLAAAVADVLSHAGPGCDRSTGPVVTGSCCISDDWCAVTTQAVCPHPWTAGAVCTPSACAPPSAMGACCREDGVCVKGVEWNCQGVWQGDVSCTPNPCPQPTVYGSCCRAGLCTTTELAGCGGVWIPSTLCQPNPCAQPGGSCCQPNGVCTLVTSAGCTGDWTLSGTCQPNLCPQPTGACCAGTGACTVTSSEGCLAQWTSGGICQPNLCAQPTGACCTPSGGCAVTTDTACPWQWSAGAGCAPNVCPQPTGACCRGLACQVTTGGECVGPGMRYSGNGAACNAAGNVRTPCCRADFDQSGQTTVQDIFGFLAAWFQGSPTANFTGNGAGAPTVQSVFDFLAAWFGGC